MSAPQTPEQRDPNVMTLAEASRLSGVPIRTLYRWMQKGAVARLRNAGGRTVFVDVRQCYPRPVPTTPDPSDCAT